VLYCIVLYYMYGMVWFDEGLDSCRFSTTCLGQSDAAFICCLHRLRQYETCPPSSHTSSSPHNNSPNSRYPRAPTPAPGSSLSAPHRAAQASTPNIPWDESAARSAPKCAKSRVTVYSLSFPTSSGASPVLRCD
jgi:hypothetical protein